MACCVQGKLSGLCGNFDLRTVNEMRTPENIDSSTPQEFGNSWTAAEVRDLSFHLCREYMYVEMQERTGPQSAHWGGGIIEM